MNLSILYYELCKRTNTPGYRFLVKAAQFDYDIRPLDDIIDIIRNKPQSATKYVVYRMDLNPELTVHTAYSSKEFISDCISRSFSRLR